MNTPRPYVREPARTTWYLANSGYMQHMAQELSSVFVAITAVLLLRGLHALAGGEVAWQAFLTGLGSPLVLGLLWLLLITLLYHSISWFAVTPKAMPVQIGEGFLSGIIIAGAHYLVWAAVSLIILYFAGAF